MLKQSMISHCQALMSLLETGKALCQVKLDVVESMPDKPAVTPDSVAGMDTGSRSIDLSEVCIYFQAPDCYVHEPHSDSTEILHWGY